MTTHLQTLAAALAQFADDTNDTPDRDLRGPRATAAELAAEVDATLTARAAEAEHFALLANLRSLEGRPVAEAAEWCGVSVADVEAAAYAAGLECVGVNHTRVLRRAGQ